MSEASNKITMSGRKIVPPDIQRMPQPGEKRETVAEMRARTGYVFIDCDYSGLEIRIAAQVRKP